MEQGQILELEAINQNIFNCKKCSFHKEFTGIPYIPAFPIFDLESEYCAMVVGINSAWNDDDYETDLRDVYIENEYKKYKTKLKSQNYDYKYKISRMI